MYVPLYRNVESDIGPTKILSDPNTPHLKLGRAIKMKVGKFLSDPLLATHTIHHRALSIIPNGETWDLSPIHPLKVIRSASAGCQESRSWFR